MLYQCGKEKSFKCLYCPLTSKLKYDMPKHVARMQPEKQYEFLQIYKGCITKNKYPLNY
nr:unnamed protein product [Callosobruchus analis]